MFAIFQSGGKQHRVQSGDLVHVEKLDLEVGSQVALEEVVMMGEGAKVSVGRPFVKGAAVAVEVLEHGRAKKIIVFKRKRRQNYRRTRGHRQQFTLLKVLDILTDSSKFKPTKAVAKAPVAKTEAKAAPAKEAPAKKAASKKASAKKSSAKKP